MVVVMLEVRGSPVEGYNGGLTSTDAVLAVVVVVHPHKEEMVSSGWTRTLVAIGTAHCI